MTIKEALAEYFDGAEGDTIKKVLVSGLEASGDTIADVIADSAGGSDSDSDSDSEE